MSTPRLPATLALVAWTFLVWKTRINNIVADDSLDSGETAARLALSLSFTVLVVAVGWAYSKRAAWPRPANFALAGWPPRSEERRVGQECVRTGRIRVAPAKEK